MSLLLPFNYLTLVFLFLIFLLLRELFAALTLLAIVILVVGNLISMWKFTLLVGSFACVQTQVLMIFELDSSCGRFNVKFHGIFMVKSLAQYP